MKHSKLHEGKRLANDKAPPPRRNWSAHFSGTERRNGIATPIPSSGEAPGRDVTNEPSPASFVFRKLARQV